MEIKKKCAIIIIHGIGEQNPYGTLDQFARGIINDLSGKYSAIEHKLINRNSSLLNHTDSYIRLQLSGHEKIEHIDVHEYYWANLTERKINLGEISDWIQDTINGAKEAQKNIPIIAQSEDGKYYRKLVSLANEAMLFTRFIHFLLMLLPNWAILKTIREYLQNSISKLLIDYVGDIAIYTSMDIKAKNYETRQKILEGSVDLCSNILKENYDSVVIAGHSLGSVIAYDTLNKLNIINSIGNISNAECKKITGLITFGSPLDKTHFFFKQRAGKEEYIRGQILEQLYSLRILNRTTYNPSISNPVNAIFDEIAWFNFFHTEDPISGRLDFYSISDNIKCTFTKKDDNRWGHAHLGYWTHQPIYSKLLQIMEL